MKESFHAVFKSSLYQSDIGRTARKAQISVTVWRCSIFRNETPQRFNRAAKTLSCWLKITRTQKWWSKTLSVWLFNIKTVQIDHNPARITRKHGFRSSIFDLLQLYFLAVPCIWICGTVWKGLQGICTVFPAKNSLRELNGIENEMRFESFAS